VDDDVDTEEPRRSVQLLVAAPCRFFSHALAVLPLQTHNFQPEARFFHKARADLHDQTSPRLP
jgi:hypothetical protein